MDDRIDALLAEGYGAEDIGVKLGCSPEFARRRIKRLRNAGQVAAVCRAWSRQRQDPEMKRPEDGVVPAPQA